MELQSIGRLLIIFGIVLLLVGGALLLAGNLPFPGRLPGDFVFRRNGLTIFVPIVTMLIISLVLTLVLNIILRFFR